MIIPVSIIWFRKSKPALISASIIGGVALVILIWGLIILGINIYKINSYNKVNSIVINYDTRDGHNVWTEFQYNYNNELKTIRLKGHSSWMRIGNEETLIVNPKNPNKVEILKYTEIWMIPFQVYLSIVFALPAIYFLINFLVIRRKERKLIQNS